MKRPSAHVLTCTVLLVTGLLFAPQKSFILSDTECLLDSQICPPELLDASSNLVGSSYLFTNMVNKVNELSSVRSTPYRATNYSVSFPGTIKILFTQEPIVYSLVTSETKVSITESGYVISFQEGYPQITFPQSPTENALPQELHTQLLGCANLFDRLSLSQEEIQWIDNFQVEVRIPNEVTYVLNPQDLETGIWAIQTIQKQRIQEKFEANQVLDVRFRMPVLRTP